MIYAAASAGEERVEPKSMIPSRGLFMIAANPGTLLDECDNSLRRWHGDR